MKTFLKKAFRAYSFPSDKICLLTKVNALRGLQLQSQEELDALLPSVLDRAFKGEL